MSAKKTYVRAGMVTQMQLAEIDALRFRLSAVSELKARIEREVSGRENFVIIKLRAGAKVEAGRFLASVAMEEKRSRPSWKVEYMKRLGAGAVGRVLAALPLVRYYRLIINPLPSRPCSFTREG